MLLDIAEWWLNQMRGLLPAGMLAAAGQPDARIIAIDHPAGDERLAGNILLRRNGQETIIAPLDLAKPAAPSGIATGLRLPPGDVLRREVVLPLAASRNIKAVIGFEMDRLTPFTAQELFWGIGNVKPDRASGRISLDLFFVLRAQVEDVLQSLRRIGLAPGFIEAGTGAADAGQIDLAADQRPAARFALPALGAVCALLALACAATPFLRQQTALNEATQDVALLSPAAQIAEHLRRQLEVTASGQTAIAAARRNGDALQVLATLTDTLPDGTWLTDLTLKSGDLTFDGRSNDASALIGRLSAVPGLKNPSFTAPVTRTADGSADQFSLHTTVAQ